MKQRKRKAVLQQGRTTAAVSMPGVPAFLLEPARPYDLSPTTKRNIGFLPVLGEHPSNPDIPLRLMAKAAGVKLHRLDQ